MILRSGRAALCAALVCLAACKDEAPALSTEDANVEHPGWLNNNDRKILELEVELQRGEPDPEKRAKAMAKTLGDLEQGRLPAGWTKTAHALENRASGPGADAMWAALTSETDLDPPVKAICKGGQFGLENMARVAQRLDILFDLVFRHCKVEEIGFLKRKELKDEPHHAVLGFGAVAYHQLDENKILSPEEAEALRLFVQSYSEFFRKNYVGQDAGPTATAAPAKRTAAPAKGTAAPAERPAAPKAP